MRSKLWPFKKAENPDERTTDDHFLVEVDASHTDVDELTAFLKLTGAVEINLKDKE